MGLVLNPLDPLNAWRRKKPRASKLYGAIVAQARLPALYRDFGIPDTLDGRFAAVSLHLFAVLHRIKAEGGKAHDLAQALTDRFSEDMEAVLRELGVSDLRVPKKMRGLAASSATLLQNFEDAYAAGEGAFAEAIAHSLPLEGETAQSCAAELTPYLSDVLQRLQTQSIAQIEAGRVAFPGIGP
jgi:cytochrome b pre-mRNA-processing protein 3